MLHIYFDFKDGKLFISYDALFVDMFKWKENTLIYLVMLSKYNNDKQCFEDKCILILDSLICFS